jgi:hypothetical protein
MYKVSDSIRMNNKGLHKEDGLIRVKRGDNDDNDDNECRSDGDSKRFCVLQSKSCVLCDQ